MPQPRFLLEQELTGPGKYALGAEDSHHAAGVLRLGAGDAIVVFDGFGRYADAVIESADGKCVLVTVDGVYEEAHLPLKLTLATAIPKGKRWQILIEKCTELGVDCILPMLTERSVAKGEGDDGKWRRWIIEAAKQSRRSRLPEIGRPVRLADMPRIARERRAMLLAADPEGENPVAYRGMLEHAGEVVVMIGPEGGFERKELEECKRHGAKTIRLSPFNLRVETAAAAVCAIIRQIL